jgi:hypothetical protein
MDFPGRPAASVPAQPVSLVLFASQRFEIRFTHRQLNRLSPACHATRGARGFFKSL